MSEGAPSIRLSKAAREFNIGVATVLDFLNNKGFKLGRDPNAKLTQEMYTLLVQEFASEKHVKEEAQKIGLQFNTHETITIEDKRTSIERQEKEMDDLIIKNVSLGFQTKQADPEIKEAEPPIAEPVEEEKKTTEKDTPDKKKRSVKKTKAVEIEPEKEDISPDLKIVESTDLKTVEKKTAKKGKGKKKDEESEEVEKKVTKVKEAKTPKAKKSEPREEQPAVETIEEQPEKTKRDNFLPTEKIKLEGPIIVGSIKLPVAKKQKKKEPVASSSDDATKSKKKKRKRIRHQHGEAGASVSTETGKGRYRDRKGGKDFLKPEISKEDIERQIKETLSRLSPAGKSKASKYRRQKRDAANQQVQEEQERMAEGEGIIQVTEFVTANELATMIKIPVTDVISTCMTLGMFVSINQRLDAETLTLVAEEFGYKVEFVSVEVQEAIDQAEDTEVQEDNEDRPPIVTVMGHVDHGKTKLLDFIRESNVVAGEAGGITQHIGAYEVTLKNGKEITFLDTPGHEAFTAMRARGAKVTDVAIIVIAVDETVMPQTKEAINHAQAAGVPIVFALNKIDKPNANSEKIREELSKMNILVEEWGGKYQSQEISAKAGTNIDNLLEKVLLEAEILDLKANSEKLATGTVIESSLDKGRGHIAKLLVQNGTLRVGDIVLAGSTYGRVKAIYNERNQAIAEGGPSTPLLMLGLNGAPQAGEGFNVMLDERETKSISNKRMQLQREQGIRTQKHITLDEIGRRIAIGDFKELNIIVKADVDGSVEALADSLIKLSTENIIVNVIHKSVGQISESDVLLASASNAIIIGFQVRPSVSARKLAENEQIDIRLYSIIYQAIEEIKASLEGMLAPEIEEKIVCNVEVREIFKITKVGTIAGCYVLDGKIHRNTKVRIIRDGIVAYSGLLASLKRFKDDVKEVSVGYECGLNIENFNDIKVGDIIEGYDVIETKRKL
ncbi:MAG: translation initiation factor IF-2 [Bacteroidetes bacterium]|nr:translation initiation factor IF-2 [Bacteroidota bacterium]